MPLPSRTDPAAEFTLLAGHRKVYVKTAKNGALRGEVLQRRAAEHAVPAPPGAAKAE